MFRFFVHASIRLLIPLFFMSHPGHAKDDLILPARSEDIREFDNTLARQPEYKTRMKRNKAAQKRFLVPGAVRSVVSRESNTFMERSTTTTNTSTGATSSAAVSSPSSTSGSTTSTSSATSSTTSSTRVISGATSTGSYSFSSSKKGKGKGKKWDGKKYKKGKKWKDYWKASGYSFTFEKRDNDDDRD
jgi:hypothetical protein